MEWMDQSLEVSVARGTTSAAVGFLGDTLHEVRGVLIIFEDEKMN